jgi:hypothetical protein
MGTGGAITPGVYVLTGYVSFGSDTFPRPGSRIFQTLYMTSASALLVSDDDNNFAELGSYTYAVTGNQISVAEVCEYQPLRYRAFPGDATFTVSGSILEFFDATRRVRSTFQRIE